MSWAQTTHFDRHIRDLPNGDVIARCDVEYVVAFAGGGIHRKDRIHDVVGVDVAFALQAIPQNPQTLRIGKQTPDEVIAYAMGLSRSNDVGEAKGARPKAKHMTIGAQQRFTGQLARAVSGDRQTRSIIFLELGRRILAVNTAPRRIENPFCVRDAHGFKDVLGEIRAFPKVNVRLGGGLGDVRVGGQMDHRVATFHGFNHGILFLKIGPHHGEPVVFSHVRQVTFLTTRKIVVDHDSFRFRTAKEASHEVAA